MKTYYFFINRINYVLVFALFLPFLINFYHYYLENDFKYIIEARCNPSHEYCYMRDCKEEDCPPNNFKNFKRFSVSASDFSKCSNYTCQKECLTGVIHCDEIKCGTSPDDKCSRL